MDRIRNLQALRGVAVLLVLAYHVSRAEIKYGIDRILPDFLGIGMSGVDLFFAISGFVIVTVARGNFRSGPSLLRFLYRRAARIVPLYWIYTALALGVFLSHPAWVNSGGEIRVSSSFLMLPQDSLPLLMVGWTLTHEMFFYLVFALFLFLPEKILPFALLSWGACTAAANLAGIGGGPWGHLAVHPLTLEFIGGCYVALLYHGGARGKWPGKIGAAAALIWLAWFSLHYVHAGGTEPSAWKRVLYFGVPAALAVYSAAFLEKNAGMILPRWLMRVGDASYSIYLSHVLVLSAVGRLWSAFSNRSAWDNWLMVPALALAAVAAGVASHRWLEKPLLKKFRDWEKRVLPESHAATASS